MHQARPQEGAGTVESLLLFEREPGHRHDCGHDPAALLVEVAGRHRDHAAQVPAASERLQGERRAADLQRRRGARAAAQHDADLRAQLVGHGGLERRRVLAGEGSRRVVHAHPRVELAGQFCERGAQAVGPERRERDRLLGGERPAAPRVGLGRDRFGARAGDRDERRAVRHLEQRHPLVSARLRQNRRDAVAHDLGAEAESDHPSCREATHVRAVHVGVVLGALELRAGGQQRQTLRQERGGVGEVGAVHPPDRGVERTVAEVGGFALETQVQIASTEQCAQGGSVGCRRHAVSDRCTRSTVATPRMYIAARAAAASFVLRSRP